MPQEDIQTTDTLNAGRTKINNQTQELYGFKDDLANDTETSLGTTLIGHEGTTLRNTLDNRRKADVTNVATLKALVPTNGEVRSTQGYYSSADQGSGTYTYDAASTATSNNGTVIRPNSVGSDASPGRWLLRHQGYISVAQFGVLPQPTVSTTGFNAAFATQLPVIIPSGDYHVDGTLRPNRNRIILGLGQVRIYGLRTGTFDEILNGLGAGLGKFCVWDMKLMYNTRLEGVHIWGSEDDPWITNRVCFGSTGEVATSEDYYAGKHFVRCQAWRAEWAIYVPDSGTTTFGVLTGSIWESFECHTTNGIYGGANQDDVTFANYRIVKASGYGLYKKAGQPWNWVTGIFTTAGGTATAIHLEPGAILSFAALFIESGDNLALTPIKLNAGANQSTSISVDGMSVNAPDGTRYITCASQGNNQFKITGLRDRHWNGTRNATRLVHMDYTDGQTQKNKGSIGYLGVDGIDLVSFASTDQQFSRNNISEVRIESLHDIVTYKGIWWTLSLYDDPPLQRHTLGTGTHSAYHLDNGATQGMLITVSSGVTASLQGKMARSTTTNSRWFVIRHDMNSLGTLVLLDNAVDASSIFALGGTNLTVPVGQEVWFQWNGTRLARAKQVAEQVSANRGDTSPTLTMLDAEIQRFATTLTANRTVTLPATGGYNGKSFRIVRTGLGAFTLDVGGLKTIPSATAAWVDVAHDGSAWVLTGYGTL